MVEQSWIRWVLRTVRLAAVVALTAGVALSAGNPFAAAAEAPLAGRPPDQSSHSLEKPSPATIPQLAASLLPEVSERIRGGSLRRAERRRLRKEARKERRKARRKVECGSSVLCAVEVNAIVRSAVTALDDPRMTVAVVDRVGNILALFRKPEAFPQWDDLAVGAARSAAFFSNNQAPLSSRTVRFLSGVHFPPGVMFTPNGALYGIENTNRGCDLNVTFKPGKEVPQPRSVSGTANDEPCDSTNQSGCGLGIVTGKADLLDSEPTAVNPGGVPIFRPASGDAPPVVLGGVGVVVASGRHAEFAAFQGTFGDGSTLPVPEFPLPAPGNVFLDGIRLPFVKQVRRPSGTSPGEFVGDFDGRFRPRDGVTAPTGYLVGPFAGSELSRSEVERVVEQAIAGADRTRAAVRLPPGQRTRMIISIADLDGRILALYRMEDALVFSVDVAVAKARNIVYFSGPGSADLPGVPPGTAITPRAISFGAQPFYPPGIEGSEPGPFFDLFLKDSAEFCTQGDQEPNRNQNGVVFFPGGVPLYRGTTLIGGLGISGDGVDQDDYVAFLGARGFLPPQSIRSNQVFVRGVRLPFLKFPRNPEG